MSPNYGMTHQTLSLLSSYLSPLTFSFPLYPSLSLLASITGVIVEERDDDRGFVRVTSILEPPFLQLVQSNNSESLRGNDKYEGFIADLLREIGERASINYMIYLVKDGRYGMMDRDGQWSGMIGELIRREAEIAAAPLTRTRERERYVDFSYAFMSAPLTMLVPMDSPYETVADLVNSSYPETAYGVIADGSTAASFRSSTQPPYSLAWANMASKTGMLVNSANEGMERVKKGDYVLIGESPDLEYRAKMADCELRTTETFYIGGEPRSYALAMPSGHPYLTDINEVLLQMQEEGKLNELYMKWWSPQECASAAPGHTSANSAALVFVAATTLAFILRNFNS